MNGLALAAALALTQAPAIEEPGQAAAAERSAPVESPTAAPSLRPAPPAGATGEGEVKPRSTSTPTATSTRSPRPTAPAPLPDREDAERAARAFLEALARGDSAALAGFAAERFSFDGDVLTGKENIRRTWRDLLAARLPSAPAAIGALEVLQAPDAAARYGKPPARIAPLVQKGVMVGIGDVGGRTVVLFLAREHGRMAVLGMHD
jgi:hypothetical protein